MSEIYVISFVGECDNPNIINIEKVDKINNNYDKSLWRIYRFLFVGYGYAKCTNCIYFNNSYNGNKNTIYNLFKSILVNYKRVQKLNELYE